MNEKNYIQTTNEITTFQDSLIENIYIKVYEAISDVENTSKEKYIAKSMLIESSNDMNTQEKLASMDKNYKCRDREHWKNTLYYSMIPLSILGITIVSPILAKNIRKLLTA